VPVTFANFGCIDPKQLFRACSDRDLPTDLWAGQANAFRFNAGEEPATGAVLLSGAAISQIDKSKGHDLVFEEEQGEVTFKNVNIVDAECVVPGAEDDESNVYLVRLADQRHFFKASIAKGFNIWDAAGTAYTTDSKNGSSSWTWSTMVQHLWEAVGTTNLGAFPGLPFTPHGTPEGFEYWDDSAWHALNDVLHRIGCAIVNTVGTTAWTIVRMGEKASDHDQVESSLSPFRLWDNYPNDPNRSWRPGTIRVAFERVPFPGPGSNPFFLESVTVDNSSVPGVDAATTVTITDDMARRGSTSGATLTARANERAVDWLRIREFFVSSDCRVLRGVQLPAFKLLGRTIRAVTVHDRGGGIVTELAADQVMKPWARTFSGGKSASTSTASGPIAVGVKVLSGSTTALISFPDPTGTNAIHYPAEIVTSPSDISLLGEQGYVMNFMTATMTVGETHTCLWRGRAGDGKFVVACNDIRYAINCVAGTLFLNKVP
jgi:hypothetical protein